MDTAWGRAAYDQDMRRAEWLGLLAVLSIACGITDPSEFSDPRETVRVKAGDEFVLALDSNPTTGYTWQFAAPLDEAVVRLSTIEYKRSPVEGLDGIGGKERWRFVGIATGSTEISLKYAHPFVPTPLRTALFTVEVR
jgi:inhibitor of cysteine peptidase